MISKLIMKIYEKNFIIKNYFELQTNQNPHRSHLRNDITEQRGI